MVTQARLKELLQYCPNKGVFIHKIMRNGHIRNNPKAGYLTQGYRKISVDGTQYSAHRLVFLWMNGKLPEHEVDHINHNRDDNRWANLRPADPIINAQNRSLRKDSFSGFTGVNWNKTNKRWRAFICVDYKVMRLGSHKKKSDAVKARVDAEIKYGFHINHGT